MLVLTRRLGESVVLFSRDTHQKIGVVSFERIDGRHIRLGFAFPDDIIVVRDELLGRGDGQPPPASGQAPPAA